MRGKMHLFDSEDSGKYYRKNINREIIKAYNQALEFVTGRIRGYCAARGADYMLVCADDPLSKIFFEDLVSEGVIK